MTVQELDSPAAADRIRGRSLIALAVLSGAMFLEGIDVAMFNVALPQIRDDVGMSTGELQWIMTSYVLGYGGFVLVGGRAADLFGRRRVFLAALLVFVAFSGLGAIANEGWMLIAARAITGIAAAFMAPASLSLVSTMFTGRAREQALMVFAGVGAGGFSIGLVLGGLLTLAGWRWVFIAPLALSIVLLAFALPLLPRGADERRPDLRVDWLGAASVTGALVALVVGIEQAVHAHPLVTGGLLAVSAALFVLFVRTERRAPQPLVRLGLLRNAPLVRANLGAGLLAAGFLGFQFVVVLYLQELRGWGVLETSLAMLVLGIDVIVAPVYTPKLITRFGHVRVALGGLIFAALSYALFLPVTEDWTYAAMFPSFLALGLAFSFAYGPLTLGATEGVAEDEQGLAGGVLYTVFQFGGAIGLSAATALLILGEQLAWAPLEQYRLAVLAPLAFAVLAVVIAATGVRRQATVS